MKTQITHSNRRRSVPVQRINIVPLLAILAIGAIGGTLILLFPMDWMRTPDVAVSVKRGTISPNADGDLDTVPVLYSLSSDATVKVDVLDETRSVVRVLMEETPQVTGQHTMIWDGLDQLEQVLPDGTYFVRVAAQGTVRSSVSDAPVNIDTQPPIIRLANLPEDMQVGGDERELLIEGVTDPDATVWLNERFQPLEVTESGSFSTLYALQEGVNRIELVSMDEAGNQISIVREITLLTEPPNIQVLNPKDGVWINRQMLNVQGTVPVGTQVWVNRIESSVDERGSFDVDVVLDEGENVIRIEAIDAVGNVALEERRVYLSIQPPPLSLTTVRDGMTVRESSLLVVGQTAPHTTVWLNGNELVVDNTGGFQEVAELIGGENIIRVEAMDQAGNTTALVRKVTYASAATEMSLPSAVRTVLGVAGAGLVGVILFWLVSGIWQNPLSLVLRAVRPTFAPGADGRLEPAIVMFETSRSATVTAEIWDTYSRHVATGFYRQRRDQGEHFLVWDGRDERGQFASAGDYEVEVSASTLFNTVSSSIRISVEEEPPRPILDQVDDRRRQVRYGRSEW